MSVGWLKVRRTDEKQKIIPHALSIILEYLVCWSWHAYFKLKDHQIIGTPHGIQSWTESWKMKQQTHPPHPHPPSQIMDETAQKPKRTIFPPLFGGKEV